ncbi:MAG TPA: amidohydrolase family protein, partial [Anaerolineae bacterium]
MDEHYDVLIAGGLVVTGRGVERADVGIRGEQVVTVAPDLPRSAAGRVIDAQGFYVLPGAIDVHTHPVYLDDLGGISVTAAHGGVTTMLHYGYVKPGQKLLPTLEKFRDDGLAGSVLDFGLHAGLFDVANQIEDVPGAFAMGITSFKVFMAYAKLKWMTDDYWMTALMDVVAALRGLVAIHAENGLATDYLEDKFLREGRSPIETFAAMRPDVLEAEAINRAMSLAHLTGCALYVVHNSAAACLEPLRRARANGWKVYGETCPQYLTLTEQATLTLKAQAKIGPPLRTVADNEALWAGLADDTLQTVGSDHAPKAKNVDDDFFSAAYGSPQIETMLPVVYDAGVNAGRLTLPRLVQVMSENPARIFGLYPRKGTIAPGADADIVLYDPNCVQTLVQAGQHSHANYTLYEGRQVTGKP